ncbi:MAG TPA: 2-hydroxyacid dehydrogenase [Allosphingosinicella sp.]|uniref:2-hydroxyacid dehydrogenase n=1 Tax=Allosphingosinicella sp. TaxID=2823234 RepID=UPI002EDB935B
MKVAVFSAKPHDRRFLDAANAAAGGRHELIYFDAHLTADTALLADGAGAVCAFVNDHVDRAALSALGSRGISLVALRSAGFNNVDFRAADELGIAIARVPAYSPEAVAEHTAALILSLNRKIHRAYARVREGNFTLDGLLGFTISGRTVGIVGAGRIGIAFARIMLGFGCEVIAYDPFPSPELEALGGRYVSLEELLKNSDIVSLHCPLTAGTRHLIDADALGKMKLGAMLINTSRGGVVDTRALIAALKSSRIGQVGLDVYEEEEGLFFEDMSGRAIGDDVFARLLTFPNVLITGHQGFFTAEALTAIAETTIANLTAFEDQGRPLHSVVFTY